MAPPFAAYKYDALNPNELDDAEEYEMRGSAGTALHPMDDESWVPTEEQQQRLRRVSDNIPWAAFLIALIELAERFSFYGSTVVFTNFIQFPLPTNSRTGAGLLAGQSGALGKGQRASTAIGTFYVFWGDITPLVGAYIADIHLGRFNTVCVAVVIALLGHIMLIFAAIPGVIEHPDTAMIIFLSAIVIMGLGTGLFKANISTLVAEQYTGTKMFVVTTESGEQVIVDPALTVSRIYMYFYLMINVGSLIGQIGMTYSEKYVGFWLAYTLPTLVFLLCPFILFLGRKRYIRTPPTGSVLAIFVRLLRFGITEQVGGRTSRVDPIAVYRGITAPDFWDRVKPSKVPSDRRPLWMTFNDAWVDELQRGVAACKAFTWFPIYWLAVSQMNNNLTSQAATMTTAGWPNDILSNIDPLALIILIPLCDSILYPALQRRGINFSSLKRITAGFLMGSAAMIWAAAIQNKIYQTNPCGYSAATCVPRVSPLTVWAQAPAYLLIALSEIFASITGLQYAYQMAPANMRSLVMSLFLLTGAVSAALGEAFLWLSADPLLVWNYAMMAILAGGGGCAFWFSVRRLDAQENTFNALAAGAMQDGPAERSHSVD